MIGYICSFAMGSFCYAIWDASKGGHTRISREDRMKIEQINL